MKEYLYGVNLLHEKTDEPITLYVWGKNTDDATNKLAGVLFGYGLEYIWMGTQPEYRNNQRISRDSKEG